MHAGGTAGIPGAPPPLVCTHSPGQVAVPQNWEFRAGRSGAARTQGLGPPEPHGLRGNWQWGSGVSPSIRVAPRMLGPGMGVVSWGSWSRCPWGGSSALPSLRLYSITSFGCQTRSQDLLTATSPFGPYFCAASPLTLDLVGTGGNVCSAGGPLVANLLLVELP